MPITKIFNLLRVLDGLNVYEVPAEQISEIGHAYCGKPLFTKFDRLYYGQLLSEIKKDGILDPLVLYYDNEILKITDGWHRWKIAMMLSIPVPAVIFDSRELCHLTENIRW